jgi:hypothetical protein
MAKAKTSRKKTSSQMVSDQEALQKAGAPERTTAEQDTSSLPPCAPTAGSARSSIGLVPRPAPPPTSLRMPTGWQKHSVLGALSRLRARGSTVRLDEVDGRKAYRIERPED